MVAKLATETVAAPVVWALVACGAAVSSKDKEGDEPCHWAAALNHNVDGAAAAAAALIAAGASPHALNGTGKTAAALVLRRKDVARCSRLLEVVLGQAAASRRTSGEAALHPASHQGAGELLAAPSAPPLQADGATHCPVCLEPGACFTGPCGHLVCEGCAQTALVR